MDEKILIIATEAAPYAKSGGLGDVTGTLPKALRALGADARVVLPKYQSIPDSLLADAVFLGKIPIRVGETTWEAGVLLVDAGFPLYLIENDHLFARKDLYGYPDDGERFAFFCKAAVEMQPLTGFSPHILHCNDWQTAPVCLLLKETYRHFAAFANTKSLFTIHNLQYQGNFPRITIRLLNVPPHYFSIDGVEFYGQTSFMKAGLNFADGISTVSPTYAREIQTAAFGYGMEGLLLAKRDKLTGILNGIDYDLYPAITLEEKAEAKKHLQRRLGLEESDGPILTMVTRLAEQKGLELVMGAVEPYLQQGAQFVVLGTGEARYEAYFRYLAGKYPGRVSANLYFDEALSREIYQGGDIFLMPSYFEPCGLGQMIALRYGNIPVVRKTGGLADTVTHFDGQNGNGFVFRDTLPDALSWGIGQAICAYWDKEAWTTLRQNAMACDFSWQASAKKYLELYGRL